jgi:hypothetical protein
MFPPVKIHAFRWKFATVLERREYVERSLYNIIMAWPSRIYIIFDKRNWVPYYERHVGRRPLPRLYYNKQNSDNHNLVVAEEKIGQGQGPSEGITKSCFWFLIVI